MFETRKYDFTSLTDKLVEPEELFINFYGNVFFEYKGKISSTQKMCSIINDKYKKADLKKFINEQCQHLSTKARERLITLLRRSEKLFSGTLCTCNTTLVNLKLTDDTKTVCSQPYPVPRVY